MRVERWQELFGIEGKVAVVTDSGGLSSIDVAPLLAEAGATVVIADRDPAAVQQLADQIVAAGGKALAVPTNVEDEAEVIELFNQTRETFGRVDILVNCAGLIANQPLTQTTSRQWDDTHSVNLRSVFLCMREGVRLMLASGNGGRIVNVTTMGSLHPALNGNQAYGSSRAGVTMLTKTTALDHAKDGILVNTVLPGAVVGKTRFHESTLQAMQAGWQLSGPDLDNDRILLGYHAGKDIATAVLYLVGPAGAYTTGQSISLDSGFLIS